MSHKAFKPTLQDQKTKCAELYRDIKLIASENKYAMEIYLSIKDLIKQFHEQLDDKALQECFYFIAGKQHNLAKIESTDKMTKIMDKEILDVIEFEKKFCGK